MEIQISNKVLPTNMNYINSEGKRSLLKSHFQSFSRLPKLLCLLTSCMCSSGDVSFFNHSVFTVQDGSQAAGTSLCLPCSDSFHSFTCNCPTRCTGIGAGSEQVPNPANFAVLIQFVTILFYRKVNAAKMGNTGGGSALGSV